jgi:hypothetical protein
MPADIADRADFENSERGLSLTAAPDPSFPIVTP